MKLIRSVVNGVGSVVQGFLWPARTAKSKRTASKERKVFKREAKESERFGKLSPRLQREVAKTRTRLSD